MALRTVTMLDLTRSANKTSGAAVSNASMKPGISTVASCGDPVMWSLPFWPNQI